MNPITFRLATLAGARPDAIRRARMDIGQATTIGVVMLITATIACLTMGYALHRAFIGDRFALPVAVGGGMLWGAFILTVDRLLLLGIDKNARWYRTALQLMLRIPIAVVLGVAISKPVILRISQSILDRELRDQRLDAVRAERGEHEGVAGLTEKNTRVNNLDNQVRGQEARVQKEPDSYEYKAAQDEVTAAERQHRAISSTNNQRIARARNQIRALDSSDRLEDRRRVQRLQSSIGAWNAEIRRASAAVERAKDQVEKVGRQWVVTEKQKLDQLRNDRTTARTKQKDATDFVVKETEESKREIDEVMRANLVNEYTILRQIQNNPKNPDAVTLKNFELALDFLFILFELTPLLAKMFSKTSPLDHATTAIEEEERERIWLEKLAVVARMQKLVEVSYTINDEALEQWANARLEEIQQSLPFSTQKLRSIRAEIEKMSA
jgi:Domain of unknown function (DUF4407)